MSKYNNMLTTTLTLSPIISVQFIFFNLFNIRIEDLMFDVINAQRTVETGRARGVNSKFHRAGQIQKGRTKGS